MGPGTPRPTPITFSVRKPVCSSSRVTSASARPKPSSAEASVSIGSLSSASTRCARFPTATRRCEWPKSTPTTIPASALSETLRARLPPEDVGVTTTVPASFSSRTMFDTVAAESPVLLAISAWVSEPAIRTALSTRSRLARCSEDCDPGVSTDMFHPPEPRRLDGRPGPCRVLAAVHNYN